LFKTGTVRNHCPLPFFEPFTKNTAVISDVDRTVKTYFQGREKNSSGAVHPERFTPLQERG